MSELSEDLRSFLDVVQKVTLTAADGLVDGSDPLPSLADAGLVDLARDTAEEIDSLVWLTHAVRVASEASPSLGLALAGRYAADVALGGSTDGTDATFSLASAGSTPVAPALLAPTSVVVLETDEPRARVGAWADVAVDSGGSRTGLRQARLTALDLTGTRDLDADPGELLGVWDLLTGAVLLGIARRLVSSTSSYVMERRQFGAAIGSFAGLRALVAEMALRADGLQALLDARAATRAGSETVSAVAGRIAMDSAIDAIQAHGGYGYIEEYPVAELLRDAISVQARAGGRRLHVARVAEAALGRPDRLPA